MKEKSPSFLVCRPDHFEITAPLSPHGPVNSYAKEGHRFFAEDPSGFKSSSLKQWHNLMEAFIKAGAHIIELPTEKSLPYQVFTADASLSFTFFNAAKGAYDSISIISKFSNTDRAVEAQKHKKILTKLYPERTIIEAPYNCEGKGDIRYDRFRNIFWAGYTQTPGRENAFSGRTDHRMHDVISKATFTEIVGIELSRPFFHLDTVFAPLPRGHIMCCTQAMSTGSLQVLMQNGFENFGLDPDKYLIDVSIDDAKKLACNVVSFENKIFIPRCSPELKKLLERHEYEVSECNVDNFIHAGGAIHCLTNPVLLEKRDISPV